MLQWVAYAIVHAVFVYDFWLDQTGRETLSEKVWDLPYPDWVPYVASLSALNAIFFLASPELSGLFLAAWLLGHWSR